MSRPLRILYIHRSAGPTPGGALADLLRVLERLDRRSFDPIALLSLGAYHEAQFATIGVRSVHFPLPAFRKAKSLPRLPVAAYRLARLLTREAIDLVHVNDADDAGLATWACRWAGIPCVVHVRSELEPAKFKKLRVHRADCVLAVSEAVCGAARLGGVPPERACVVYSGVDVSIDPDVVLKREQLRTHYGLDGATVIGAVANLSPIKGPDVFVDALGMLGGAFPNLVGLWLGGDDHGMRKGLEERAEALGIGSRMIFCGFQPDVRSHLAVMDLFVLSSRSEGLALSLLEAMAAGVPVIATRAGGVSEVIVPGESGLLVDVDNPVQLADAMCCLLSRPDLADHFRKMGRVRVCQEFNLEAEVARYCEVYETLTCRGTGRKAPAFQVI